MGIDLERNRMPLEVSSLCIEFAVGAGCLSAKDAELALSRVIYECYWEADNGEANREGLKEKVDTRFVDALYKKLRLTAGMKRSEPQSESTELARMWLRYQLTPMYPAKTLYLALACY